ncbi:oxidoreductase [Paenibacillus sacheonensis]|uniref:SDR family NAD(P)-dependent oxidoreductase n=1 Tax=Paenibacillus sacheonensis TaxID=742054 RepID=A0A7X4YUJ6_9BACL|nr:oxidoreductase [Paenibacillus sacheonensis]MBM7568139.1 NAD(P)-dependent dehydrogenase (short-subunit alcohol dehydrogenase family) [Paenibacillus sacheonensis]NBC71859.1 SDR family NAD(P)-dependent oxidoreductase [Paenibacillus sacheonensis]
MAKHWDEAMIPDQSGKTIVITGSSSGLGLSTAMVLAGKGAEVILAVRDIQKGNAAADQIKRRHTNANVKVMKLDLGSQASIRSFAAAYRERFTNLSVLINNAGVMMPPYRKTADGFELQFGTNHLGHYALTGQLLPLLLQTSKSRIVTVGSLAARSGRIDFDNLDGSRGYRGFAFYRQSKLANVLFAKELQRRLAEAGAETISVACHPGIAATNITSRGSGNKSGLLLFLMKRLFQSAEMGALPSLYATTVPSLHGGEYIGPDGKGAKKGYPTFDTSIDKIYDPKVAKRLWEVSERLTGHRYSF